jgi:DNA-binding CsgD family transcriptional regulator
MTFEEIGYELGISSRTARFHYENGLRKLRSRSCTSALQQLHSLAQSKATRR